MRVWVYGIILLLLTACGKSQASFDELRVGTLNGPEAQLMQVAQNVAFEKYGLKVKVVEFKDYNSPNEALKQGYIDVNMFQHEPFLISWNANNDGNLIAIARTFIYPMAIYSFKLHRISEVGQEDVIAIPNDITNQARSLLLLQKAGLITLRSGIDVLATTADIVSNPLRLQIKTMPADKLPQALTRVDAAIINSNYAVAAGLIPHIGETTPSHYDALYVENKDSLYANVFVVRPESKNNTNIQKLISAFQSPQVFSAAQTIFKGDAIKAW